MTAKLWAGLLAAVRSIDKRGKGKTVLVADYNPIHAALGDASLLAQFATVSGIAPAAPGTPETPETYAPTIPIALPPIETVGEVTHQWLASCDKHDGTNVASGVTSYTPTPTVGGGTEILGQPTDSTIGSPSPSPTYTRSGVDWNMTCGGTSGLDTTADTIAFRGWACTSSQALSAVVGSISSSDYPTYPSDYSGAGIMLRDSTAAGSKFLAIYYAQNKYVYVKWRSATNGAVSETYAVSDGSLGLLYIIPDGSGGFGCYRQTSGQPRQLVKATTSSDVSLAATGIAGTFCFSLTSNALSASFTQIALRSKTYITKTTTTAVPVALTLLATDVAGNVSAASDSVTATPSEGVGTSVRWDPGFFIGPSTALYYATGATLTSLQNTIKADIDRHMGESILKGFHFLVTWDALEHTKNVYDFSALDTLIAYLNTNYPTKKWSIEIWDVKFAANGTNYIPTYLSSESDSAGGWTTAGGYATKANSYKASITTRKIALHAAFAAHYAADTTLAKVHTEESAFDFTGASGWNIANEMVQFARYYEALADNSATLQIPYIAECNFYNDESSTEDLIALAASYGLGIGGPDTFGKTQNDASPNYIWGQAIIQGKTWNGSAFVSGGHDYRGEVPICYQVQEPAMVGYSFSAQGSPWTFADIYNMSHNVLYNNYTNVWLTPVVYGANNPAFTASNAAVAYIVGNSLPTRTTLPSIYAGSYLTLTDIASTRVIQRTGTTADVSVSGTYTGTFTDVQCRVLNANTDAEVVTWTTVDASLSGGTWSGSVPAVPQSTVPYKLQARIRSSGTVAQTVTGTTTWYVGAQFGLIGSSTPELWAADYSTSETVTGVCREFNADDYGDYGLGNWHAPKGTGVVAFLNAVAAELGCAVAMIPWGRSGSTLAQWGTGMSYAGYADWINNGVTPAGGKLEGVVCVVGLNDAPSIVSRASHLTALRLLRDTVRTDLGQATLKWYQLASQRYVSGTDAKFNFLHQAETDFGADSNTYLASSIGVAQEADQLHPTAAGMRVQGNRVALLVKDAIGDDTFSRGPIIASIANVDGTHTDVTITHRGGTDFTPTSGITGFQITDNAWSGTLAISAAARQSATVIRLTHAAAGGTRAVRYMWGAYPTDSGYVKDNTTLTLPLEFNAD